eukprot:773910-Pelagomonas_calceolata.AAC.1
MAGAQADARMQWQRHACNGRCIGRCWQVAQLLACNGRESYEPARVQARLDCFDWCLWLTCLILELASLGWPPML